MASKKIQIVGLDIPQADWNQTDETQLDYIKNKPDLDLLATMEWVKEYVTAMLTVRYYVEENDSSGSTYHISSTAYHIEENDAGGNTVIF